MWKIGIFLSIAKSDKIDFSCGFEKSTIHLISNWLSIYLTKSSSILNCDLDLSSLNGILESFIRLVNILAIGFDDPTTKTKDLSQDDLVKIRDEINNHLTEGDLRREVSMNIKTKMEINSYQGSRHKKGLPVRGQRTNRNARTRKGKGKTVANKKKV